MVSQTEPQVTREEIQIKGEQLITTVQKLLHEGNVRRIIVKRGTHIIAEFPLTVGVLGVLMAPMLAAVGAISALVTDCTVEVERVEPPLDLYIL
ncbi:MAG TPA: DUF4342 domain-containing protein [Ktedonobacteraceae bacterium]|nr:DUF4342 domain-containing protein [Ktedonobacteraceae bacterium]